MATARELLVAALVAALLAIFARTFLVQAFRVPSDSMAPGLLAGDHILVNKFIYGGHRAPAGLGKLLPERSVRRGDVVVVRSPREPRQHLVKRCLGLPGESLSFAGERLSIDGRRLDETGYLHRAAGPAAGGSFGPATVPEDALFLLGDHRRRSQDSRSFGPVPAGSLTGRAVLIYWSTRPIDSVAESGGLWDKIARSSVGWLQRCRWRRLLTLIR